MLRRITRDVNGAKPDFWSPATRLRRGVAPIVRINRSPSVDQFHEPSFDLAVFDDGLVLYEGDRCVKLGGLLVKQLDVNDLRALRESIATSANTLWRTSCDLHEVFIDVKYGTGKRYSTFADRCRGLATEVPAMDAFAREVLRLVGADAWIGKPGERLACLETSEDLGPGDFGLRADD